MLRPVPGLIALLLATLSTHAAAPADWPQWRGPNRDGVSTETGLLDKWPTDGPRLAWKTSGLGAGFSSVTLAGDRIFTAGDIDDASFVIALNRADGSLVWKTKLGRTGGDPPGPRGTPSVADGLVFALGQHGDLVCVAAATGQEVWRKSLARDFGGQCGGWLYSESPLLDGDRVICTPGGRQGTLVALDRKTGALRWRCSEWTDSAEYSSPIIGTLGGIRQYIQLTGQSVAGIAADSGKLLWRAERAGRTAIVPTPISSSDLIYVTSGYGVGCNLFRVSSAGTAFKVEPVYANRDMVNHHGGVIRVGKYVYGHSDSKGWLCQELETGRVVWSNHGVGKGAVACADGHLYLRSESGSGTVALVRATPDGYQETGRFDQPDRSGSASWAHPVVAGGRLYLRDQGILLCYDVKGN